jgi:hypothetical protein
MTTVRLLTRRQGRKALRMAKLLVELDDVARERKRGDSRRAPRASLGSAR